MWVAFQTSKKKDKKKKEFPSLSRENACVKKTKGVLV